MASIKGLFKGSSRNMRKAAGDVVSSTGKTAKKSGIGSKLWKGTKTVGKTALYGAGILANGAGSFLGNLLGGSQQGSQAQNGSQSSQSLSPEAKALAAKPSETTALAESIHGDMNDVSQSSIDADQREAATEEAKAKYQDNLMKSIIAASEALNRRTVDLVRENGLNGIDLSDTQSGTFRNGEQVPKALMTRGQIARLYERQVGDNRMTDVMRLLAANNELLGNIDLHIGLLIKQGSVIPKSNLEGAKVLKKLADADERIKSSLDSKARERRNEISDASKAERQFQAAIANQSDGKGSNLNRLEKAMGLMAGLGIAIPVVASLADGLIYNIGTALGLIEGEDSGGPANTSTSYENIEGFNQLSREEQEEAIKQGAADNMKWVAGSAAIEAGVLGSKKAAQAIGKRVSTKYANKLAREEAAKAAKKASSASLLKKLSPKAMRIIGKRVLTKVGLKAAAKSAAKKVPIVGAAFGIWNGIKRAVRGDWAGAGLELASGLMGGSGVGILGSLAIDAGLVYRDYKAAMKALEEGDMETLKNLGITNEDIAEITREPSQAEIDSDDGRSPESVLGVPDPNQSKIDQVASQAEAAANGQNQESINIDALPPKEREQFYRQYPDLAKGRAQFSDGKKHAKGGWILGPSHEDGGVFTELEGGEFVVRKDVAQENRELLENLNANQKKLSEAVALQMLNSSNQPVSKEDNSSTNQVSINTYRGSGPIGKLTETLSLLAQVLQGLRLDLDRERKQRVIDRYKSLSNGNFGNLNKTQLEMVQKFMDTDTPSQSAIDRTSEFEDDYSNNPNLHPATSDYRGNFPDTPEGRRAFVSEMFRAWKSAGVTDEQAIAFTAQAALESGYGTSRAAGYNNYGGVTAKKGGQTAGPGSRWAGYNNMGEYINDKLKRVLIPNFPNSLKATTVRGTLEALQNGRGGRKYCATETWGGVSSNADTYVSSIMGLVPNVEKIVQAEQIVPEGLYNPPFYASASQDNMSTDTWQLPVGVLGSQYAPWMKVPDAEISPVEHASTPVMVANQGGGGGVNYAPQTYNQGGPTYNDNRVITVNNSNTVTRDDAKDAEV